MGATDAVEDRTRLRVKLGAAEIEYEGGAASLERLVMPTVAKMIQMVESHVDLQRPSAPLQIDAVATKQPAVQQTETFDHMTHSIAVAMKADCAGDLAMAASARLGLVKKRSASLERRSLKR